MFEHVVLGWRWYFQGKCVPGAGFESSEPHPASSVLSLFAFLAEDVSSQLPVLATCLPLAVRPPTMMDPYPSVIISLNKLIHKLFLAIVFHHSN